MAPTSSYPDVYYVKDRQIIDTVREVYKSNIEDVKCPPVPFAGHPLNVFQGSCTHLVKFEENSDLALKRQQMDHPSVGGESTDEKLKRANEKLGARRKLREGN